VSCCSQGGQRDFGLHKYADAYARNGFAVLCFDYRGFGGSDGEPRQLVSPQMQLEDWDSAIKYAQVKSTGIRLLAESWSLLLAKDSEGLMSVCKVGSPLI
jgi:predicted alpha/beta hydrolase